MDTRSPAAALLLAALLTMPRAEGLGNTEDLFDANAPKAASQSGPVAAARISPADRSGNRAPEIPLYEDYRFVEDYRVNQTILGVIRWGTIAPLAGAALGGLLIRGEEAYGTSKGIVAGLALGIPLGATLGYLDGRRLEERQARDSRFHARRMRFGYELEFGSSLDQSFRMGGLAISYRFPSVPGWSPDEIQAAFEFGTRSENADDFQAKSVQEGRYGLRILKGLRDGLFNPYLGATVGYANGQLDRKDPSRPPHLSIQDNGSPFVDILGGLKLNLFDLAHLKAQVSYEPFGLWNLVRDEGAFPYQGNLQWRMAIGTYIL